MKGFQMPRYKLIDRGPMLLPVVLEEQIQPGTFEFALDRLVDTELDLSALDAKFNNDEVGASAYDPRLMLKIVLLGYSRGLISSRRMEQACLDNIVFMAISGTVGPATRTSPSSCGRWGLTSIPSSPRC
jgi:transposase